MLHAKIGELTLERDFLAGALGKGDCWAKKYDPPRAQTFRRMPGEAFRLEKCQRLCPPHPCLTAILL
jgi:hypothetical protein